MYWLKSCTRCGGDLYDGVDIYGRYTACTQCGYYLTEGEQEALCAVGPVPARAGVVG